MSLLHFEDLEPGTVFRAGPLPVTRESIIAFAQSYDPQPFHLDETAASASLLGGLAASGWQTAAIGMRLFYEAFVRHAASMGAPGLDELRWQKPVRPGDTLSATVTLGDKRASTSRPDRGFVAVGLALANAAGDTVMTQRCPFIVQRRGATQAGHSAPAPTAQRGVLVTPPADLMLAAFYEDVEIGHESRFGAQLFTPDEIVAFAKLYDPQYFHLDAEAAKASHFGGLIASGWQTAAFWMKHYIAARRRASDARAAAGLASAIGGPSPGFVDLKWLRPVYAGETISYGMRLTGKRATHRPGWGLVSAYNTGHTADGTLVFSFESRLLWPMRSGQQDGPASVTD